MKLRKIRTGLLVLAIIGVTGITAFAASEDVRNTAENIKTYEEGEMPAMPDGAVMLEKEELTDDVAADLQTYEEGEMPAMPDGAVLMNRQIID